LTGYRKLGLCPSGDSDYCNDPDIQIRERLHDKTIRKMEERKKTVGFVLEDLKG